MLITRKTVICLKRSQNEARVRPHPWNSQGVSHQYLVLDERIDEFREILRDEYGIDEFGDPSSSTEVS